MEASSESVNDTDYLPAMSLWDDLPNALTNPLAQGLKYIAYYMIACIAITLALATFGQFSFIVVAFFGIDLIPQEEHKTGKFLGRCPDDDLGILGIDDAQRRCSYLSDA